nr:Mo-dependent nitrogenase C-terminal domain-containing protein [Roseofilum sp. Guam]
MISTQSLERLKDIPIFGNIKAEDDVFLAEIANQLGEIEFPAGHTIFRQDERGSYLYILVSGAVEVHIGGLRLAHFQPGDYFGEMSVLDSQVHSASVTALEECKCLVLSQKHLYEAIEKYPELGLNIIRLLCQRVRTLNHHITAWLRGLLTIAWADGEYNPEEQELIAELIKDELGSNLNLGSLKPITGEELAAVLGRETSVAENFLRTGVIMALANGTYSEEEDRVLQEYCAALEPSSEVLDALKFLLITSENLPEQKRQALIEKLQKTFPDGDVLHPVRDWLDGLDINTPYMARFLCKMIPPQCPFERDIKLFGHKIVHIPPMCKLNPLYEQLVGLRFRALSYLADDCKEDISRYI